mmetsp:Transcript_6860/g.7904  ORF Transcript_6860/g.7904 Transcript_6860/m.7904 type:complete len:394 (+) Transcript_6860:130-1311(+)
MKAAYLKKERPAVGQLRVVLVGDNKRYLDSTTIPTAPQLSDSIQPTTTEIIVQEEGVNACSIHDDDIHMPEATFVGGHPFLQESKVVIPCSCSNESPPLVIGSDFDGIITAVVGSEVNKDEYQVGQRVCGMNHQQSVFSEKGSWAEFTVTQEKSIVSIPDTISFIDAAAAVMPLFVIHGLLEVFEKNIKGKERILVIGASGGIGSMLVTMLRKVFADYNLYITGVCSGRNKEFVLGLGADRVADYTKGPIEISLKQGDEDEAGMYDVVFDIVGGQSSYKSGKAVLRKGGSFISCVGPEAWIGDEILSTTAKISWVGRVLWYSGILNKIPGSHPMYYMVAPSELGKATYNMAFENKVIPHVDEVFPFDDIDNFKNAMDLVRSHRVKGKVVMELK